MCLPNSGGSLFLVVQLCLTLNFAGSMIKRKNIFRHCREVRVMIRFHISRSDAITYEREELEQMSDQQLRDLYNFYDIQVPENRLMLILRGDPPFSYGFDKIYSALAAQYPRNDEVNLLVEGILYYYRLVDTYGINPNVISSNCIVRDPKDIPELQPITVHRNDNANKRQLYAFRDNYLEWFSQQAEQLLPFEGVIDKYVADSYRSINDSCRRNGPAFQNYQSILMHAFTLASPTPTDLLVYRRINYFPYKLDDVSMEKGFMSTNSNRLYTRTNKGTICQTLFHFIYQKELSV